MSTPPKAVIYNDRSGEWRWRVTARNGRILAVSSEGYVRKIDCKKALTSVLTTKSVKEVAMPKVR